MAERALPAARTPRTVTVRVRALLVAAAVLLAAAAMWWSIDWATGLQPISAGSMGYGPHGLVAVPHTDDPGDTGPPVYRWSRGGSYVVTMGLHNSASVPVTITGVSHPSGDWGGSFSGPVLRSADPHRLTPRPGAFHEIRIPADGWVAVAVVFPANPAACGSGGDQASVLSQDGIDLHFTTLGVVHGSEWIPLQDAAVYMQGAPADC